MVSILIDRSLRYPSDRHCFSPHCHYPEYKHAHISPCANDVYDSIRKLFVQQNLDAENMDTPDWNPLGKFIRRGVRSLYSAISFITADGSRLIISLHQNAHMGVC